ncbi:MAG: hypothetical protein JNL61_16775 [Rhizobiaceae bacterium]|nr:hypothetical protein [Rhizobiaceae bacterium]
MADFVAVLRKTLDGLGETTPETREKVYDKARSTIAAKLAAINPPPPAAVAERQKQALEDAIKTIERDFVKPATKTYSDPIEELESVFASLGRASAAPLAAAPKPEPIAPKPEPVKPAAAKPAAPKPVAAKPAEVAKPKPAPIVTKPASVAPAGVPKASTVEPFSLPKSDPLFDSPPELIADDPLPMRDTIAGEPAGTGAIYETPRPRSRLPIGRLIGALVVLAALGGAGYGLWLNRDDLSGLFRSNGSQAASTPQAPADDQAATSPEDGAAPAADSSDQTPKFTQRLQEDGSEVDAGPAGGEPTVGEGTSVAAVTSQPPAAAQAPAASESEAAAADEAASPETPPAATAEEQAPADAPADVAGAAPATTGADGMPGLTAPVMDETVPPAAVETATVPVGQKAIFYEERTNVAEGSAAPGTIVWSLVQESPGADLPPEPAIRAEATIPGKDIQLRMTIRRNADKSLPASHIVEMIFLTPDGFEGGGIDNVLRMSMKSSEQEAGSPLLGIPAKIADGFFLVALNDSKAEEDANMTLLRRQSWIDVPLVYKSGRRALFTMEKGIPGDKVFDEALKAWQAASG